MADRVRLQRMPSHWMSSESGNRVISAAREPPPHHGGSVCGGCRAGGGGRVEEQVPSGVAIDCRDGVGGRGITEVIWREGVSGGGRGERLRVRRAIWSG
jgi:hypothetical protein